MKVRPLANALSIVTLVLTAGIFVVDLLTPGALAVPFLYAVVILLSLGLPGEASRPCWPLSARC